MEPNFTEKEFYAKHFVPKDFLKSYCTLSSGNNAESDFLIFFLKNLHRIFTSDGIQGDTLIDIGSGPSIYHLLSACESFREIIATDYTDQNREEMQRWLKKEPGAFDWTPVVKYVCELEGDREKWPEKEAKVQRAIKQVLKCDVTQSKPLAPMVLPPADCLMSSLCLETACKDHCTYRSALKHISSLVKPGGHFILSTVLEENFYIVGRHTFSNLYLEREVVEEAVREAGFVISWAEEIREKWPEKEQKIRRAVKQYLKCDVTQPNPLAPLVLPPVDCLLSTLRFDGACRDIPTYRSAFRNISSLLKPGGHLLFYSSLEGHYYTAGQCKFSALYLEKEVIEEAVRQAGFVIKWIEESRIHMSPSVTDGKGMCILLAQKSSP